MNPEDIDYVNAHGTSTSLNDKYETLAIKKAFGDYAYKVSVSSTKGTMGHSLGAAGALESIACIETIRNKVIAPTINYETPDPECDLDITPNVAKEKNVRTAYGSAAEGVIAMEHAAQKNETAGRLRRIDAMERQWDEIRALLLSLPSSQQVMDLLRSLDSPYLPAHIGVEGQLLKDTFLYCKEVRVRYTFLQMLWDLGLLDDISDAVIAEVEA